MRISAWVILMACILIPLAGCEPKAKPVAPKPQREINLIGDLEIDPHYDPTVAGSRRFDPAKSFVNSVGMQLVPIRAGRFFMGSPIDEDGRQDDEARHGVTIGKALHIGVYEVTQKQWQAVMQSRPWHQRSQVCVGDHHPATYITWQDANFFCQVLSQRENRTYRLPTEAEWEYACRAGEAGSFYFESGDLRDHAWFADNANGNHPAKVGGKSANAWGLYDMHGNVAEWCGDWYANYVSTDTVSPCGPKHGEYRVTRGGSWESMKRFCRSAYRAGLAPDASMSTVGFRIVLEHD